jgi:glycosyltransferase involved in cell wall biosynthesis
MPTVTVIIPTYNRCNLLTYTINSVLAQSYKDFEILVIDDGSTDNTRQIVAAIGDSRIKYIYKNNGGVSSARNLGLKKAAGQFIAFLDHDDYYPDNLLEILVKELKENPDYGMAYSSVTVVTPEGKQIPFYKADSCRSGWVTEDMFKKGFVWTSSSVFRKDVLNGIWYDENLKKSTEDFDAYLRLSTKCRFLYVPRITTYHRALPDSLSNIKGITCSKPLVLERFYFNLGGDKYVSKKVAYKKMSHSWRKVAQQYYKAGYRKAAIKVFSRAIKFWPLDIRLYLRIAQAFLINKNSDKSPDWQMPSPLGLPAATDSKT